jgi:DNA-binding Lrp family transcriptional regulator
MDKLYLQVADFARQGIMTAHNINPILAGINTPGALGQRNEAEFMFDMLNMTYIQPIKEGVFEKCINTLMEFNGMKPMYKLKDVKPFGIELSENFIQANLPADIKTKLAADYVGIDIASEREKMMFKEEKDPFDNIIGEDINKFEILAEFNIDFNEEGRPIKLDRDYKGLHFAKVLEAEIGGLDADIIGAVKDNPKISPFEIAQALGESENLIREHLDRLQELKVIVGKEGSLKISKLGEATINEQDVKVDIRVMYKYDLSPTAPALVKGGRSRDWCIKMMNKNALYTREQIDGVSKSPDAPNGSAWFYRGGYYNNPKLKEITPFCRHIWKAVVVRVK